MVNFCPLCKKEYQSSEEFCLSDGERLIMQKTSSTVNATSRDSAEKNSVLASVMAKFGLKKAQISSDDSARVKSILPPSLIENGWTISGTASKSFNATTWPVTNTQEQALFVRFLTSPLTEQSIYIALKGKQLCDALPTLVDCGTVELNDDIERASYELLNYQSSAGNNMCSLSRWLQLSSPSEEKALLLLASLTDMLKKIQQIGLYPMFLSPTTVIRNNDTAQLSLTTCGALAAPKLGTDYRPELEHSSIISRIFTAPEITQQLVTTEASAVFSVGQLLAVALWGQGLDLAALRTGQIAFSTIKSKRLCKVLQGALWPDSPAGRWSIDQLVNAVNCSEEDLPKVPEWGKLSPNAAAAAFHLAGQTFWRLEDLLEHAAIPDVWPQATAAIDDILTWSEGTSWASLAKALLKERQQRSADYIIVRLLQAVLPNQPTTWRSLDFSEDQARDSLIYIAQRNLALDTTAAEKQLLSDLFHSDLRGAFSKPVQNFAR